MTRQVRVEARGRTGTVTYREAGHELVCHWEFGGDVVAIVQCGDVARWQAYPWALARRSEILQFVADEVVRQQAPGCRAEIDPVSGDILLHQRDGAGQAATRLSPAGSAGVAGVTGVAGAAPGSASAWVFRLSTLRMKFGLLLLLGSLIAGALLWIKQTVFSIDPGKGTPIGYSLRTAGHIATLIQTLEPYTPSLHRNPDQDRYRISLFLAPLDGGQPLHLSIRSGLAGSTASQSRILGSDGRVLWFDVAGLGGLDLETMELLPAADVARVDARSIPRPWGPFPFPPKPETYLAAGLLTGPLTWLGLHAEPEAARDFKPGGWLKPVVQADPARQLRRFYRGSLAADPAVPGRLRIESMQPLSAATYFSAAFLRPSSSAVPLRLADPAGSIMVFTSAPGLEGTTVVARVDDGGQVLWQVDTGIDRFKLEQILLGENSAVFVGTRPPVPDKVSEPLLVIVDYATGKAATHSLWQ